MTIRPATEDDLSILARLKPHVHNMHAEALPDRFFYQTEEDARQEFERLQDRDNMQTIIVEYEDKPVGYLLMSFLHRPASNQLRKLDVLYINQIAIHPDYRRKGCGHVLIKAAKDLARERNMDAMELSVWLFNQAGVTFFESEGFKPESQRMIMEM